MKKIVILLCVFAIPVLHAQEKVIPAITVSGEGMVNVVPDQAIIKVRVENEGNSAKEVKALNDEAVDRVLKFLNSQKIDSRDIKTEYLQLNKNYDYQLKKYKYMANQSLSIVLKNLDLYEHISEGLLEAGINRIDGILFKSTKIEFYKSEARKKAVQNAKIKAEEYAKELGQSIGKAIHITESGGYQPPQPLFKTAALNEMVIAPGDTSETIAVGQMELKSVINIVFELK